jgi:hypothetical protein
LFNELVTILIIAVGHMKMGHGGHDMLVPKQRLHGMRAGSHFNKMSGKTMSQRVRGGLVNAKAIAIKR